MYSVLISSPLHILLAEKPDFNPTCSEATIPQKYRELIALAVSFSTQCPYCIEVHTKAAKGAGASREEITESSFITAALRAGGAATHGAMALKFYDQP